MSDLISIIIPVFNCEDYLRACVCSILQQTYKDFELILVDGGGTDTSGLICDEFATIDNRIKVIHKNNEGVSIARNKGIDIAKGNWLCFIDSDDTITPDYLEKLHPHNQETKQLDLILCNITDVYPNQISRKRPLSSTLVNDFKSDYSTLHSLLIGPVIKLYKASIIKTNKLYFPSGISCGEDEIFNFQYYKFVQSYKFIDEGLYFYYHRPNNSLSQRQSLEIYNGMLFKLKKEQQFYLEQHINKAETCLTQSSLTIIFNYYQLNSQDSFTAFTKRVDQLLPFLDFTTTDLSSQYKQALDFIHKRDYASLYDLIRLQHNC